MKADKEKYNFKEGDIVRVSYDKRLFYITTVPNSIYSNIVWLNTIDGKAQYSFEIDMLRDDIVEHYRVNE